MQAIILAAGMGKRLRSLTANNTKCMVKVNGVTLIERMLTQLDKLNLKRIVIVVGYEGKKLMDFISTLPVQTPITYVENAVYNKTNNIYSLWLAKELLKEDDTILLESDIIFEEGVLQDLVADPYPTLALVDKYESWMDGTVVKIADDESITDFIPGSKFDFKDIPYYYKTVNIYKFSKHFSNDIYVPFLDAYSKALGNNEYYEQVLRVITMLDHPEIRAKKILGYLWYEIDDIQDLDIAESMFALEQERVNLLSNRFGGYWRYPKLLDFCYLVNPHYPPSKLMNEIKANFEVLLTQYPSGVRVNSLLASKNFGVKQEYILVGNGAAELIKGIMNHIVGSIGIIRPTFEEYSNRYPKEKQIVFFPENPDFSYTADDLILFFEDKNIAALVLINPDNPTGNYIEKKELHRLASWLKEKNIFFILDESFADFADELDNTFIEDVTLESYPNMIVLKSISKSYGVPGLRLGIAASANKSIISQMKKEVAIWNINSIAEFYLQIEEKYKKDYIAALAKFREDREHFVSELSSIEDIRVIPSQANYMMLEIQKPVTAAEMTRRMLAEYDILVKDLSNKFSGARQFIRVAVKKDEENMKFVHALKKLIQQY